jgi:hypothetical protein
VIQSRGTTRLALAAIISNNATDEAYEVAARAGFFELFPGVVYRSEDYMSISVSTARTIIKQAVADEVTDMEMPDDDATIVKKAEELVEMAEQAWASNVRGPEVEKILKLAAADGENEDEKSDAEPEPSEDEKSSGAEPSFFSDLSDNYKKTEPYEGYADDRVSDITSAIDWYMTSDEAEMSDSDQRELLQNVWAFEKAHKDRARILKFVSDAAISKGFIDEEEIQTEALEDAPEDREPEAGSDDEGENGGSFEGTDADDGDDGAEQGKTSTSEASSEDTDADDDAKSETSRKSGEGSSSKAKSSGQNQSGGFGHGSQEYRKLIDSVETELARERVDVPKPPSEDAPELPWNWAEVSDQDLQDIHMQFASLAYYKSYQRAKNERVAFHCKEAADAMAKTMMIEFPKDKDFKVTVAEATIESDERVKRWRKLQKRHEAMGNQDRQEAESYHKLVEALSRLESMRHNSYLRSQGK